MLPRHNGRYRNVRREQTLIKFSGVQPNSGRTAEDSATLRLHPSGPPLLARDAVSPVKGQRVDDHLASNDQYL